MATYKGTIQIDATPLGCGLTVKSKREGEASKQFPIVPDWVCNVCKGNAGAAIIVDTSDGPPETITGVRVG